ncbi:MAG: NAD(P)-dependent oxidoreductase [Candidatus Brocadiaceae bacterium]|nr:NAD(P)-dependent oxidoreductase [Candidatus Brocadiaceae bacterium]
MRFLVTGCTSYIAKYVINRLLEQKHTVLGISRSNPEITHGLFTWVEHDLSANPGNIKDPVDIIVHMAAQSLLEKSAEEYIKANILVTRNVKEVALRLKPRAVIYASSIKIYGEIRDAVVTEETDMVNPDLYGVTKYLGEKLLEEAVPTISLRMPGVIAVGSHGWINNIYHLLKRKETISFFDAPYNHVIHAHDIFGIINTVSQMEKITSDYYNVCAQGMSTSLEVIELMSGCIGCNPEVKIRSTARNIFHTICNKKLLNIYKPLDVFETMNLYLIQMKTYKE